MRVKIFHHYNYPLNQRVHQSVRRQINFYIFLQKELRHPGVIECSPPNVIGKSFLYLKNFHLLISDILFKALLIFLSILKWF